MTAAADQGDRVEAEAAFGSRGHELRRRARRLEIVTTAWNVGEVVVTVSLGLLAHSLALIAFGLDSLVEVFASLVVLWHLGQLEAAGRARRAGQLVSASFIVLALYLTAAGINGLVAGATPARSLAGIGFLGATVVVMVLLSRARRTMGSALSSAPMVANANMGLLDAGLAAGVLVALIGDLVAGWWWADALAALIVAAVAFKEGAEGIRESA